MMDGIRLLALFLAAIYPSSQLNSEETCDLCHTVLRAVHGHFSADIPSRRKLTHQLKHECNRHYNYRRRCMLLIKDNCDVLNKEMREPGFNSTAICFTLKECSNQPVFEVPPIAPIDLNLDKETTPPPPNE